MGLLLRLAIVCLAVIGAAVGYDALSAFRQSQVVLAMWGLLGVALGLACHEGGHLLCARLGALPVHLVSVGIGPLLLRFRLGQVLFELRPIPLGGLVATYPMLVARKYRMLAFILGGVLGNVALIGAVAVLAAIGAVPYSASDALRAVVAVQFFLIVISLIPARVKVDGVKLGTDGLQLLQLLWSPRKGLTEAGRIYAQMLAPYAGPHQLKPTTSSAAPRILYQLMRPDRWTDRAAFVQYREALERELTGDLSREEELLVLDSLITNGLIWGEPAFRARLDEWSLRALQLGPGIGTLRGSRGAVLVEVGRWEEGKSMLEGFVAAEGSFDLLMNQIYLGRAEHALGNTAAAERFADAARKTGASHPESPAVKLLLPRLEAELGIHRLQ